jgi:uncharacterized membrane protein YjdF
MNRVSLDSTPRWMQFWLLLVLPLIIIFGAIVYAVDRIQANRSIDLMFLSAFIAIVLALLAFRILLQLIPITFVNLWPHAFVDQTRSTHDRWCAFIHEFEGKLNHWHQGLMGVFFARAIECLVRSFDLATFN